MDCSPLGSSVHGIFQARILEWIAISFSRGSSWTRDQTPVSCIAGRFFTNWATREAPHKLLFISKCQQQSTNTDVRHKFKCKPSCDWIWLWSCPFLFLFFYPFWIEWLLKWFYFSSFIDLLTITPCSVILVIALIHIYKMYSSDILHHIYCKNLTTVYFYFSCSSSSAIIAIYFTFCIYYIP